MKIKLITALLISSMNAASGERNESKIQEVLRYSTGDGGGFGGTFPSGYHTIKLGHKLISGQRNPWQRLEGVPYDFSNKVVLDLGSNIGGMLFAISDKIKYGIGLDFNSRAINCANLLKEYYNLNNVSFYAYNLEKDGLGFIKNFILKDKVDICFILSMAAWVSNWKELVIFASEISETLLFEAHGPESAQIVQMEHLGSIYSTVILIRKESHDDPINKNRSLFICYK